MSSILNDILTSKYYNKYDNTTQTPALLTQYKLVFFIIRRNSSWFISPSPSLSASSIISCQNRNMSECVLAFQVQLSTFRI